MQSDPKKLLSKNEKLIHSDAIKVSSHVQREDAGWVLHTLMIEGL